MTAAAALVALAALGLAGPAGAGDRPNILLLSLDTTRADGLGCHGRSGDPSPALDRLAARGVRFAEARTCVPITLPAHVSLLTGTYPERHGVHLHTDVRSSSGPAGLAEILSKAGYRTAAFIASRVLDSGFGLDRGFDVYADEIGTAADGRPADDRRAAAVTAEARAWFERRPAGPYFAWLHFYDPHLPLQPPEPFASRFAADPYIGEIAYMDAQIGEFLEWLEARGELAGTIVVAVADHGESLGEHGIRGHTEFVYQEVLAIPLILVWPDHLPAGTTVNATVRLVDVAPTLLELAGLDAPASCQGRSLRRLCQGRAEKSPRPSFFESRYLADLFGWAPLLGVEEGALKLIRAPRPELYDLRADPAESRNLAPIRPLDVEDLEDLLSEFLESSAGGDRAAPRAALDPEVQASLQSLGYASGGGSGPVRPVGSSDPKDHLRSVALYQKIMAGPGPAVTAGELETARELARLEPDQPRIQELLGDFAQRAGEEETALAAYTKAHGLNAGAAGPALKLAEMLRRKRQLEEATGLLKEVQRNWPREPQAPFMLGQIAAQQKDYGRAEMLFKQALDLQPAHVRAASNLAELLRITGRGDEAVRLLEASLRQPAADEAELAYRHYQLGSLLASKSDQRAEACRHLERALGLRPDLAGAHYYLAILRSEDNRPAEAAVHARRFLELSPESPQAAQMRRLLR